MSKLNLGTPKNQWNISGLSRSALLKRRSTPGTPATGEKTKLEILEKFLNFLFLETPKPEIKTSLSTPRTSLVSKITESTVITKKKLEFASKKFLENEEQEKSKDPATSSDDKKKKSKDPVSSNDDTKKKLKDPVSSNDKKRKLKDPEVPSDSKKKKLKVQDKDPEVIELSSDDDSDEFASLTDAQLAEMLEERKKELEIYQRHETEKAQLLDYTIKWKEVGNDALETLQGYYKMSRAELMLKMRLDDDIFD